jgi:hypothetical protein
VLIFRSNNNIVIPPARTGKEAIRRKAVTTTVQTNNLTLSKLASEPRKFQKVVIKFRLLRIEPRPAK